MRERINEWLSLPRANSRPAQGPHPHPERRNDEGKD